MSSAGALLLRVPSSDDVPRWTSLFDDAEVMRYIGAGTVRDQGYYAELVERQRELAASTGLCLFSVVVDDQVVGFAGIHPWSHDWGPRGSLEVGWRLGRRFWGHGYATRAARTAVELAQERQVPHLVSMIQEGNAASAAVARKLGMAPEREHRSPHGALVQQFGLSLR